jgi:hypothetical protein
VKRQISEKTLELNVCAEILHFVRRRHPKAVWQGLTQAEERAEGLDEKLRNAGPGFHFLLQFKSPAPSSVEGSTYKFSLNTRQHLTLRDGLCRTYPNAVHYVFPLFAGWSKVDAAAPDLMADTWLMQATSVDSSSWAGGKDRHPTELTRTKGTFVPSVQIRSPQFDVPIALARDVFETLVPPNDSRESWVPTEVLRGWVDRTQLGASSAMRWRGLYSLFLPA